MPKCELSLFKERLRNRLSEEISEYFQTGEDDHGYISYRLAVPFSLAYLKVILKRLESDDWLVDRDENIVTAFHPAKRADYLCKKTLKRNLAFDFEFEKNVKPEWATQCIDLIKKRGFIVTSLPKDKDFQEDYRMEIDPVIIASVEAQIN